MEELEPLDGTEWQEVAEGSWFCGVYRYRFDFEAIIHLNESGRYEWATRLITDASGKPECGGVRHLRQPPPRQEEGAIRLRRADGPAVFAGKTHRRQPEKLASKASRGHNFTGFPVAAYSIH